MRQLTTNVYEFSELNHDAQQQAIKDIRNDEAYMDWDWSESVIDDFKRKVEREYDIHVDDVRWSGFWSQGDGCSFTGTVNTNAYLLEYYGFKFNHMCLYDWFNNDFRFTIERTESFGHYVHENTVHVFTERLGVPDWDGYTTIHNILMDAAKNLEGCLEDLKNSLCKLLYKELEDTYESYMCDDAIIDYIISYEFEFDANGNRI